MAERPNAATRDEIGRLFAELTGILEDAAARACNGQSPRRNLESIARITDDLRRAMDATTAHLGKIDHLVTDR